ncbi:hypothetical protein GC173_06250 [bacterium]|nr:hypothetical protein [bacterium]
MPGFAAANPIGTGYLWKQGLAAFLTISAFIVLSEAFVLARLTGIAFRRALAPVIAMNALSALVGLPVNFHFWALEADLAKDMIAELNGYAGLKVMGYVAMLAVSLSVEAVAVYTWKRWRAQELPTRRVVLAIIAGNLLTYAILCPVAYALGAPPDDGGMKWSTTAHESDAQGIEALVVDSNGSLFGLRLDGSREPIIDERWSVYCATSDLRHVTYRSERDYRPGPLVWMDRGTGARREWDEPDDNTTTLAISPDGRRIAFCTTYPSDDLSTDFPGDSEVRLTVLDSQGDERTERDLGNGAFPLIDWSADGEFLHVVVHPDAGSSAREYLKVPVNPDKEAERLDPTTGPFDLAATIGPRRRSSQLFLGHEGSASTEVDKAGDLVVSFSLAPASFWDLQRYSSYDLRENRPRIVRDMTQVTLTRQGEPIIEWNTRRPLRGALLLPQHQSCLVLTEGPLCLIDYEERTIRIVANDILMLEPTDPKTMGDALFRMNRTLDYDRENARKAATDETPRDTHLP